MKLIVVPTIEGPLKVTLYVEGMQYPVATLPTDTFYSMKQVWERLNDGRAVVLEVKLAGE